ncbi:MAG: hypothetical protein PHC33_01770 [Candidatus Omnitrophica bacterium]|nr:hypothetical protein [Candidatus Omnitrophota bacterium]
MILIVDYDLKEVKIWACTGEPGKASPRFFSKDAGDFGDDTSAKACIRAIAGKNRIDAVSFRILFGGDYFKGPVFVDDGFFAGFGKLMNFFPFYVPSILEMLKRFHRVFKGIPLIAFFETSFFLKLPESGRYYALPFEYHESNKIKKWGFHGIFHELNAGIFSPEDKTVSVVIDKQTTVCAVHQGRPLSISLGYTPLEGVMSRTSCGDVDPGIIFYLMNVHNFSIFKIDEMLKRDSGFAGLTGYDIELSDMLKLRGKDVKVDLAFDVYQAQIMKHIGESITVLNGLDSIVFAGSAVDIFIPIIHEIIKKMSFLGITTVSLPWAGDSEITRISSGESKIKVCLNRMELAKSIYYETLTVLRSRENRAVFS